MPLKDECSHVLEERNKADIIFFQGWKYQTQGLKTQTRPMAPSWSAAFAQLIFPAAPGQNDWALGFRLLETDC